MPLAVSGWRLHILVIPLLFLSLIVISCLAEFTSLRLHINNRLVKYVHMITFVEADTGGSV